MNSSTSLHTSIIGIFLLLLTSSCKRLFDASIPDLSWSLFDSSAAVPVKGYMLEKLEGLYQVQEQSDDFGDKAVIKTSYTINGSDTTYHLSIFCQEDVRYFVCEAKRLDSIILLNGYWRNVENTKTGKAHLTITPENGALKLNKEAPSAIAGNLIINGKIGFWDEEPDKEFSIKYVEPIKENTSFEIIAHRGGGRNSDLLPASENSIELLKLAARYGASGVEIDVKLTKDGVPILYHDDYINDRLTQKIGIHDRIEDYTFAHLENNIRLKDGQRIPTVRQALETILHQTPLRYVWLDTKDKNALPKLRELQKEFLQKAAQKGNKIKIQIGVSTKDMVEELKKLPDYKTIPVVSEMSPEETSEINANVWAQGWIKGVQNEDVEKMHAEGRRAFLWTLDVPLFIRHFLNKGKYNGLVTNRPTIVAYYHYANDY